MNEQESLIQCIYTSAATIDFDKESLNALLDKSRRSNGEKNVSGMLLHQSGAFFQILEGPAELVLPLFEKISDDPRHTRVTKILQHKIEKRDFAEWTMGYAEVTHSDLAKIDGLNDFFMQNKCLWELEPSRAQKLLEAFKDGRWRTTLS
jgi:Sensors of blue-light using FAD